MLIDINRQYKGYTIIEMLIVLALFSIFLSIAAPKANMFKGIKEQQELREFKRNILYARNKAIVDGKRYIVYLNYDNNSYDVRCNISQNKWQKVKEYKFQYGIKLVRNPNSNNIGFTSSGTASISDTFVIKDSKNRRYELTIAVNTGKVTLKCSERGKI